MLFYASFGTSPFFICNYPMYSTSMYFNVNKEEPKSYCASKPQNIRTLLFRLIAPVWGTGQEDATQMPRAYRYQLLFFVRLFLDLN